MRAAWVLPAAFLFGAGLSAQDVSDPARDYDERLKLLPKQVQDVRVDERINDTVPLDLPFTDEQGRRVTLSHYADGQRPLILTLNYYRCPKLCDVQLNVLTRAIADLELTPGRDYNIVTVSFDPAETPALANRKKGNYIRALGRPAAAVGWHFLTGEQHNIRRLAEAVGYRYKWLDRQRQYAHPAVIMILTPDGIISRYLYGIQYDPKTLRLSLVEASDGKVGSTIDYILLTCFQYDALEGSYVAGAMGLMRLGGVVTVLILGGTIGLLLLREFRRGKIEVVATADR